MKLSDVTVVAVVIDADLSIACDRKTPIFNIAFADSNSNAKSRPETKFLLIIFEFVLDVGGINCDDDNNDLMLYFKR